ncbi:lysozyme inhibitor LprI family protein [Allopusillimonas ginsengisoli]|uniref:lysozyme inhibitor LprI family protein n=1 Tax=Allopusillimonas ginsengisoli TaxID=453575 RepID=UPI00101FFD62|nr:hypothetical protein [Allopusillimonas ginsengisoli]TEA79787.1 hypothetical protein ERE07_02260 [Allopusillimonas ginsengisoli]
MKLLSTALSMLLFSYSISFSRPAMAASFDCSRAASDVEIMICQNQELSSLDEAMAVEYEAAAYRGSKNDVLLEQRRWLRMERDKCHDAPCLEKTYRARIARLKNYDSNIGSQTPSQEDTINERDFFNIPLGKRLDGMLQKKYFIVRADICENSDAIRSESMLTDRSCNVPMLAVDLITKDGSQLIGMGFIIESLEGVVESLELHVQVATAGPHRQQAPDEIVSYFWSTVKRFESERVGATKRSKRDHNSVSKYFFDARTTLILTLNAHAPDSPHVASILTSTEAVRRRTSSN